MSHNTIYVHHIVYFINVPQYHQDEISMMVVEQMATFINQTGQSERGYKYCMVCIRI